MDKKEFFQTAQLVAFREGGRLWQQLASLLENRLNVVFNDSNGKDTARLMLQAMAIPEIAILVMSLTDENTKVSFTLFTSGVDSIEKKIGVISVTLDEEMSPLQQAIMVSEVTAMGFSRKKVGNQNVVVFKYNDGTDVSFSAIVFDDNSIDVYI